METITSKDGSLVWNVASVEYKEEGQKRKIKRAHFKVNCNRCGHQLTSTKGNLQTKKVCPGCAEKPAAVKTDSAGNCISICEIGTVEFIREYQDRHSASERDAVRHFIDTVKAHLAKDDPAAGQLTEESVRSSVRRATGKKKSPSKSGADCPKNPTVNCQKDTSYSPFTNAMQFSTLAISQLTRIRPEDPQRVAALLEVMDYVDCQFPKKKADLERKAEVKVDQESGFVYDGNRCAGMAIEILGTIPKDDQLRNDALQRVIDWCENQKNHRQVTVKI